MKTIKQLREETKTKIVEDQRLNSLVEAGLFDGDKIGMLKNALDKDARVMTPVERNMLLGLVDSMISEVAAVAPPKPGTVSTAPKNNPFLNDPRQSTPSGTQIPSVLMLRRKSIRTYPDNMTVALYYAPSIDKYVSIPFGRDANVIGLNEVSTFVPPPKKEIQSKSDPNAGKTGAERNYDSRDERARLNASAAMERAKKATAISRGVGTDTTKGTVSSSDKRLTKGQALSGDHSQLKTDNRISVQDLHRNGSKDAIEDRKAELRAKRDEAGGKSNAMKVANDVVDHGSNIFALGAGAIASAVSNYFSGGDKKKKDSPENRTDTTPNAKPKTNDFDSKSNRGNIDKIKDQQSARAQAAIAKTPRPTSSSNSVHNNIRKKMAAQAFAKNTSKAINEEITLGGKVFTINTMIKNKIVEVYSSLNRANQKKMVSMMAESPESFNRVIDFITRN